MLSANRLSLVAILVGAYVASYLVELLGRTQGLVYVTFLGIDTVLLVNLATATAWLLSAEACRRQYAAGSVGVWSIGALALNSACCLAWLALRLSGKVYAVGCL